ncbi:MAG: type II toxin-antitoxin system VapC family toxin [Rhabdochlamydiaceae bacterium]
MTFFVDTSFWIALAVPRDQHHRHARTIVQGLAAADRLVTSEFVLIEVLNYFSERGEASRHEAVSLVKSLANDPRVRIVALSSEMYLLGLRRYERSFDKGWSLTDCTSFLLMEAFDIDWALAFDDHFKQAGFQIAR